MIVSILSQLYCYRTLVSVASAAYPVEWLRLHKQKHRHPLVNLR